MNCVVPNKPRHDAVFTFSTETLADAQDREFCRPPDQALLALCAAKDRFAQVIVANPWRSGPLELLRCKSIHKARHADTDEFNLVKPLRLSRRDPTAIDALQRSYKRYDVFLKHHAQQLRLNRPVVLTFNPFVAAFCPLDWAWSITYYARDDWASFPPVKAWWKAYGYAYRKIQERRARVICVSDELASRVAAHRPAVVIPNGIDSGRWTQPQPPPQPFIKLKRPIVTYAGTIDSRLDVGLISQVAADYKVGTVGLIGPIADALIAQKLKSLPNTRLCGPMSQVDLVGALMYSDACVIPHVDSQLTRAMSPLKMYEYLAAGKPVVSTRPPPVGNLNERIVAAPPERFAEAVREALTMPPQSESDRLSFVRSNSWSARHARMLKVMLADDSSWWME